MKKFSFLMIFGVLLGGGVQADEVGDLGKVSAGMADKVQAVLMQQGRGIGCEDVRIIRPEVLTVFESARDAKTGVGGWWQVRYAVAACGKAALRTAEFDGRRGAVQVAALVPGETLTDPDLQRDAVRNFRVVMQRLVSGCGEVIQVADTIVATRPQDATAPWREAWLGRACGQDVGRTIEFAPSKNGTMMKMVMPKVTDTVSESRVK